MSVCGLDLGAWSPHHGEGYKCPGSLGFDILAKDLLVFVDFAPHNHPRKSKTAILAQP